MILIYCVLIKGLYEKKKITNQLKKKILVLDGIDNDFIDYSAEIAYPEYGQGNVQQQHAENRVINFDKIDILSEEPW